MCHGVFARVAQDVVYYLLTDIKLDALKSHRCYDHSGLRGRKSSIFPGVRAASGLEAGWPWAAIAP